MAPEAIEINRNTYDHYNEDRFIYKAKPGLSKEVVMEISKQKNEPEWMLKKRLKAFEIYEKMPMPKWGPSLKELDMNEIVYFERPDAKKNATDWKDVPDDIKKTFDRLGIPEAEKNALAGAGTQYESEVVYHNLKKEWEDDFDMTEKEIDRDYNVYKEGNKTVEKIESLLKKWKINIMKRKKLDND